VSPANPFGLFPDPKIHGGFAIVKALAPVLDEIAKELAGQATIGKVNVEADPAIADRFGVKALPSLLFFRNGALAQTLVGAVPKKIIVERLTALRD
jgi:thioredoxin 1